MNATSYPRLKVKQSYQIIAKSPGGFRLHITKEGPYNSILTKIKYQAHRYINSPKGRKQKAYELNRSNSLNHTTKTIHKQNQKTKMCASCSSNSLRSNCHRSNCHCCSLGGCRRSILTIFGRLGSVFTIFGRLGRNCWRWRLHVGWWRVLKL